MTAGALTDVRHVLAVQRAQRAVFARSLRPARRSRWRSVHDWTLFLALNCAMPVAVVYAAALDARLGSDAWVRPWVFLAGFAVLLGTGHQFQVNALSFSPHELLFHASKAGVLLARLLRAWPRFAFIGAAWALACFLHVLHGGDTGGAPPIAIATCCAVAFLAPIAWNVGNLLKRIVAPATQSSLSSLVVLTLCAYGVGAPLFGSGGTAGPHWSQPLILGVIGAAMLAGLVVAWWRDARGELRALWPDVVRLPRVFVLFVLMAPTPWLGEHLVLLTAIAAPWVVVFSALGLRHLLAVVPGVEAETRGGVAERVTEHDVPRETVSRRTISAPVHRGRSPWRAAWRLHWLKHGITRADLRRPHALLPFVLWHGTGIGIAAALVASGDAHALWLVLIVGGLSMATGPVPRERLYQLGVNLRDQARLQVIAALWWPVLPGLLAGALVASLCGLTEQRALVLAALAAAYTLRIGWRGLMRRPESASFFAAIVLFSVLATAGRAAVEWRPLQWPFVCAFAVLGLSGFIRRVVLWREPELLVDLIALRERESQPAAWSRTLVHLAPTHERAVAAPGTQPRGPA